MTRAEKIKVNERLRKRYEKAFRPIVKSALKMQYSSYVSALKENGAAYVIAHPVAHLVDAELTTAIQQLYIQTGVAKANLTMRTLLRLPRVEKKKGTIGFNPQWTSDILNYFRLFLFNKVVLPISETTQDYIRRVLEEGIAEGWTTDEMVNRINRQDYLDGRVERILRTETNRAINYGNELAANTYDFKTQKRWIAVHDSRTRHEHMDADGQTVDLDEDFIVGGERMSQPGDPSASAENTVNCRCGMEIVPMRDRAGRLVPKEPKPTRVTGRLRSQVQEIIGELTN